MSEQQAVEARLARMEQQLAYLVERQEKQAELIAEAMPILKAVMGSATEALAGAEAQGWFRLGRGVGRVASRAAAELSEEDLEEMATGVGRLLRTLQALTQPAVMEIAQEAAISLQHPEQAAPVGILGMVRATQDVDVQRGMAVMLDLVRHAGRAAAVASSSAEGAPKRPRMARVARPEKLAEQQAAKPVERQVEKQAAKPAEACSVPKPGVVATVIDGVGFTADGFLVDAKQWTPTLGHALAKSVGLDPVAPEQWALIEAARADFLATGASPNLRRLSQVAAVSTRDIYARFPKAPGKTIARVAGIPKPVGCI